MCTFETVARTPPEAKRISTAFYRFLDRYEGGAVAEAVMFIEGAADGDRILIRLWSDEAIGDFQRHLAAFAMPEMITAAGAGA